MWTAKTDQTGQMLRLFQVFAGHTGHFVGFVMLQLKILFNQFMQNGPSENTSGYNFSS